MPVAARALVEKVPFTCASASRRYTSLTFGISRDPRPKAGEHLFIEPPKRFPNAIEVIGIDLTDLRIQASKIHRPDLIEAQLCRSHYVSGATMRGYEKGFFEMAH